jgi:hypothetical protein
MAFRQSWIGILIIVLMRLCVAQSASLLFTTESGRSKVFSYDLTSKTISTVMYNADMSVYNNSVLHPNLFHHHNHSMNNVYINSTTSSSKSSSVKYNINNHTNYNSNNNHSTINLGLKKSDSSSTLQSYNSKVNKAQPPLTTTPQALLQPLLYHQCNYHHCHNY